MSVRFAVLLRAERASVRAKPELKHYLFEARAKPELMCGEVIIYSCYFIFVWFVIACFYLMAVLRVKRARGRSPS